MVQETAFSSLALRPTRCFCRSTPARTQGIMQAPPSSSICVPTPVLPSWFIKSSYCYAPPFDVSSLFPDNIMASLERLKISFLRRTALCRTLQQRRVDLLTITAAEGEPGTRPLRERKWVFMSARVHPGETPAQFIIHGVIDFLTGESPRARALRGNIVFKIVPMLNPDGVVNGNYRLLVPGLRPQSALAGSYCLGATGDSVKTLVAELHEDPSVDLDFYVDIHAHSVGTNSFMYGNNIPARRKGFATASSPSSSSPFRRSEAESGASTPSWPQPTPVPSPQRQPPRDQQTDPSTGQPLYTIAAADDNDVSIIGIGGVSGIGITNTRAIKTTSSNGTGCITIAHATGGPAVLDFCTSRYHPGGGGGDDGGSSNRGRETAASFTRQR
ncbi:unnamed protein product [Ectocarpus sp. 4 AP-2014]